MPWVSLNIHPTILYSKQRNTVFNACIIHALSTDYISAGKYYTIIFAKHLMSMNSASNYLTSSYLVDQLLPSPWLGPFKSYFLISGFTSSNILRNILGSAYIGSGIIWLNEISTSAHLYGLLVLLKEKELNDYANASSYFIAQKIFSLFLFLAMIFLYYNLCNAILSVFAQTQLHNSTSSSK